MKKSWSKVLSAVLIFNLMALPIFAEDLGTDAEKPVENAESSVDGDTIDLDKMLENGEINPDSVNADEGAHAEGGDPADGDTVPPEEAPKEIVHVTFVAFPNNVETEFGKPLDAWVFIEGTEAHLSSSYRSQVYEVEKGKTLAEVKAVGLAGTSEFRGWYTEPNGGVLVSGDTVIDSDRTYYAQFNLPKPTMTADAGAYGYFKDGDYDVSTIDFTKSNHGIYELARIYDSDAPADGDRINYNVPKPTVREGYELVGYRCDYSQPDFNSKTSTNYVRRYGYDILFSNPNYKNQAIHGLSNRQSLHVSYYYESSDLRFVFNMNNVPENVKLEASDIRLVSEDGTEYTGTIALSDKTNYKWTSDEVLPEGEYTIDILPESTGYVIERKSNGIKPEISEDGKVKFTVSKLPLDADRIGSYELVVTPRFSAKPSENLTFDTLPTYDPALLTSSEIEPTEETTTTEETNTETKESVSETESSSKESDPSKTSDKSSSKKGNKQNLAKTGESTSRNIVLGLGLVVLAATLIIVKFRVKHDSK